MTDVKKQVISFKKEYRTFRRIRWQARNVLDDLGAPLHQRIEAEQYWSDKMAEMKAKIKELTKK